MMATGIISWFFIGVALFGVLVGAFLLGRVSPAFKRWFEKYFWGSE
jgi:hypothetical protein